MMTGSLLDEIESLRARFEKFLYALFSELSCSELEQVSGYSLEAGGKRIRPLLTLTAMDPEKIPDDALVFASAVEMLHTYSLVHDDLPCMDDDNLRRGVPTAHCRFDPDRALLSGFNLLNCAFKALQRISNDSCRVRLVRELAAAAGWGGMVAGQVFDIFGVKTSPDAAEAEKAILTIHDLKTSRMIMVSILGAAVICGYPETTLSRVREGGRKIGVAFQVIDDILDVEGESEILGKPALSDRKNNKKTTVDVWGIDCARVRARGFLEEGLALLPEEMNRPSFRFVVDYIYERIS